MPWLRLGQRPALLNDGLLDRRAKIGLVVALAFIALIKQANALPATLFGYDTSEPWSRFVGTIVLATAAVVPCAVTYEVIAPLLRSSLGKGGIPPRPCG